MSYQDQTGELSAQVQGQVLTALAAYAAGQLTAEALVAVVAAFLAAGNTGAAALGDLALAAAVTLATGTPAAPIGTTRPADEPERLTRSAQTILDDLDPTDTVSLDAAQRRYQRLAEAEVRKAVAEAYAEALAVAGGSGDVIGWTRGLEPEACQLCRWWWREGRVWEPDHPFQHHKGCDCTQVIVTTNTERNAA